MREEILASGIDVARRGIIQTRGTWYTYNAAKVTEEEK
jgi:hypothetical protein